MNDIQVRAATEADFDTMWEIFQVHVANGETYTFAPGTSRHVCYEYWLGPEVSSFVAVARGENVLGMYKLVPNQPGLGDHVANASFMVSPAAQGIGVGRLLGEHSIAEARRQGYLAMQFNFVISTNTAAIALWKKLGFAIVGTLPQAYRHLRLGFVDAYVMYLQLGGEGAA